MVGACVQDEKGNQDFDMLELRPCPAVVGRFCQQNQDVCWDVRQNLGALCSFVSQGCAWDRIGDCLIDALGQPTHSVAVLEDVDIVGAPGGTLDAVVCNCGNRSGTPAMWELFGMHGRILKMEAANNCGGPAENIQSVMANAETTDVEASKECAYREEDACGGGHRRIIRFIIRHGHMGRKSCKDYVQII